MNRRNLSFRIAEIAGMTQKEAEYAIDPFCIVVTEELTRGGKVQLMDFGMFTTSKANPRNAHNAHTGKTVSLPARLVVKFIPGKKMKKYICAQYFLDMQMRDGVGRE